MDIVPQERRCNACKKTLPLTTEFFNRDKRKKFGFRYHCKKCCAIAAKKWKKKNPEIVAAIRHRNYVRHRDEILWKNAEWIKNNPEKHREYVDNYQAKHPDLIRKIVKDWRKNNPEKQRLKDQRRRTKKRQLPNTLTASEWQRALEYFDNRCAVCGKAPDFFTVLAMDHWQPLHRGGATVADNVVPLCHAKPGVPAGEPCCNNSKGHKPPDKWLVERFGKKKAKVILKRIQDYFQSLKS